MGLFRRLVGKPLFLVRELGLAWVRGPHKLRILFSQKEQWEPELRAGFRFAPYDIQFGELTAANIKDYDLVVPLTMDDCRFLSDHQAVQRHNLIPVAPRAALELCDDKQAFNEKLRELGYGHLLPDDVQEGDYPYLLKKSVDHWGANSYIIRDAQQEHRMRHLRTQPDFYRQACVRGSSEYATHVLFMNGRIVKALTMEYRFDKELYIKGKDSPLGKYKVRTRHQALFTELLDAIGYEGLCCINYKQVDGQPLIFEINPRFGGSLSLYFFSFIRRLRNQPSRYTELPKSRSSYVRPVY